MTTLITAATVLDYLQQNTGTFHTTRAIAVALRRTPDEIRPALNTLYKAGKIDRMVRIEGTNQPIGWYGVRKGIQPGTALSNSIRSA